MIHALANHLWQSTVFAFAAALLTLAFRRNRAGVRHGLWFAASVKFLVPFFLLVSLGSQWRWPTAATATTSRAAVQPLSFAVVEIAEPFSAVAPTAPAPRDWTAPVLTALWLCGFVAIAVMRLRAWLRLWRVLAAATPIDIALPMEARSSAGMLEPGVVGFFRPVLLLPDGVLDRLTPAQFEAVLAHELSHARRRDNLTSLLHMLVEALFWFHPLVWWIGARLVEERERACDEAVLTRGNQPPDYAAAILNVCKLYLESPLACVSGVTGADLKQRIRGILEGRVSLELTRARKAVLAAAAMAALAAPVVIGMLRAQSTPAVPKFEVASIKACTNEPRVRRGNPDYSPGRLDTGCDLLVDDNNLGLIQRAYVRFAGGHTNPLGVLPIHGGPSWIHSDFYEINARAEGTPSREMMQGPMLQELLEERFQLKIHRETKEGGVYDLVLLKDASKLKPFPPGSCLKMPLTMPVPDPPQGQRYCRDFIAPRHVTAEGDTPAELAKVLNLALDRPVVDKTGLAGRFNFQLDFVPDSFTPGLRGFMADPSPAASDADGATIFTAIQEQLGMKLVPSRGPRESLVIDHIERPTEN